MQEEGNNKKRAYSEFQRYVRGEMTRREENAFRSRNRNDPFTKDVIESSSDLSSWKAPDFMIPGRKQDKKLIRSGKRTVLYISASVIVLVIISSLYVILDRKKTALRPGKNITIPIQQAARVSDQDSDPVFSESVHADDSSGIKLKQEIVDVDTNKISSIRSENPVITENSADPAMAGKKDSNSYIVDDKTYARDVILNDSVLKIEDSQNSYISPQPVAGSSEFRKYIDENIIRPPNQPLGEEAVAIVSFVVRTTGIIDSITVISSPGDEYAKEAIRLIREGPAWKPAVNKSLPIDDEVRLRIVF
jgi:hypothetical protein